jgi:hypothetical protein
MVLDFKVNARLVVGMTINFLCPYPPVLKASSPSSSFINTMRDDKLTTCIEKITGLTPERIRSIIGKD